MCALPVDVVDSEPGSAVCLADCAQSSGAESARIAGDRPDLTFLPTTYPDFADGRQSLQSLPKVLVVEDIVDTAHSLAEVLEIWGYEVRIAYDGQSAVELAQSFLPNFIVMDIGLPVMDGYQAAALMRADKGLGGATLIALTGYGQDEDKRKAAAAGFDAHMTKPADLKRLHELLQ